MLKISTKDIGEHNFQDWLKKNELEHEEHFKWRVTKEDDIIYSFFLFFDKRWETMAILNFGDIITVCEDFE